MSLGITSAARTPDYTEKEYVELRDAYKSEEVRLNSLYYIRDQDGVKTRFVMNAGQREFYKNQALRNVLPKARRIGFSTLIAIMICDRCLFRQGHVAGIVDRSLEDATDKLAIIRFAYLNMREDFRATVPLVRDNDKYMEWANGSSVSVGTSYRGGGPADLHISEYGKVSVDNPDAAREIKTGAIQAVARTGRIWVESTAHGTSGEFHDMVKLAQAKALEGTPLTPLDFKFQFYGWWIKEDYREAPNLVTVPSHLKTDYFPKVEAIIGRKLDAGQRAFYAKKLEQLGPDDIQEEFPSTVEELFFVSLAGAFWRDEIAAARRDKRIGLTVPHDPTRGVNTFWDIGEDGTAIWFHQSDGVRHRLIDYYEEEGGSLQKAAGILQEKKDARGFLYLNHFGPHDLNERDWANSGKTRVETAEGLGIKFTVVPRVQNKATSIEAARRFINTSWFDSEHCGKGVERMENYRKRWNKLLGVFTSDPVHDMASHGSDALQQGAMGLKPERGNAESRNRRDRSPKASHWGA